MFPVAFYQSFSTRRFSDISVTRNIMFEQMDLRAAPVLCVSLSTSQLWCCGVCNNKNAHALNTVGTIYMHMMYML